MADLDTASPPRSVHGASIRPLAAAEAEAVWAWVAGHGERPDGLPGDLRWLHATLDDGLVWGALRGDRWVTGRAFGTIVAELRTEALWEARLFSLDGEVQIWTDDLNRTELSGRILGDADGVEPPAPVAEARACSGAGGREEPAAAATAPIDECRVLLGDRLITHGANGNGFSLVGDATGARQVAPLDVTSDRFDGGRWWPLRLAIRHYLESDPATGALRIAATRFVDVGIVPPPAPSRSRRPSED